MDKSKYIYIEKCFKYMNKNKITKKNKNIINVYTNKQIDV